jgi:hypothetical protein
LHHLRDVTFAEDALKVRTGITQGRAQPAQPRHGHRARPGDCNITVALRCDARDATRVLPLLGITSP